jgi:hypothetical protein
MGAKTADEVYEQIVKSLPPGERRRLAKRIMDDLPAPERDESAGSEERHDWMSMAGIAPNLLGGEDAQEWVSRTRREADEHRERQWKHDS